MIERGWRKELAVAQAADKVHREFLEDSYVLNPSKIFEDNGFSDNKIQKKSEAHIDCVKKEDRFIDKQTNVLDAKTPSFVPKFTAPARPQFTQRYTATPNPSGFQHGPAMFAAHDPQTVQPTSRNAAQTGSRVSNEENIEAIKMLYQLIAKQGEYLLRQGAPELKLEKFGGNPMKYQYFINMFETVVEARVKDPKDRLVLLIEHTYGEAKSVIEMCLYLEASAAYQRAKSLLQENYGNPIKIANMYIEKLRQWPRIFEGDGKGIREFYVFLIKCQGALWDQVYVNELNTSSLLQSLCIKLPQRMQRKWSENVCMILSRAQGRTTFVDLVEFVRKESEVANDPTFSREALSKVIDKKPIKLDQSKALKGGSKTRVGSFVTRSENYDAGAETAVKDHLCPHCSKEHDLDDCKDFLAKSSYARKMFVISKKLCFGCYSSDHTVGDCPQKRVCSKEGCGGSHPLGMHGTHKFKPKAKNHTSEAKSNDRTEISNGCTKGSESGTSSLGTNGSIMSLSVLPMLLFHKSTPDKVLKVYGMLDNCSQGSFINQDVLDNFDIKGTDTKICIKTMTGTTSEDSQIVDGFMVSDVNGTNTISLPRLFTRKGLPINKDEIPTVDNVKYWPHLESIMKEIPDIDPDAPVALLIGVNCPTALRPLEVINEENNGPFAQRTALGWCIVGPLTNAEQHMSTLRCNRIAVVDSPSNKIAQHFFGVEETVKDNDLSRMLVEMYKHDFNEPSPKEMKKAQISQGTERNQLPKETANSKEDDRFLEKMRTEVKSVNGHYQLPLPFRNEAVNMPNNRQHAIKRAMWIKHKFKDSKYHEDYVDFMNKIITQGYAAKVPESQLDVEEGKVWYLPHHGVYHPRKPEKIRVVFDCSSEYKGTSLNRELLQGPDLTNLLVAVLMRFRINQVAFLADIESMFYQVQVPKAQRSYLRFLWWPDGNIENDLTEYEMCVHLFGAVSSPSCANFALKQTAEDNAKVYGNEAAEVVKHDFYVDDLLKSTPTTEAALELIPKVTKMCAAGGFRLTKFISNDRKVIGSIPREEQAKEMKNVDLNHDRLPMERALGMLGT